jgi:hypothetical protein
MGNVSANVSPWLSVGECPAPATVKLCGTRGSVSFTRTESPALRVSVSLENLLPLRMLRACSVPSLLAGEAVEAAGVGEGVLLLAVVELELHPATTTSTSPAAEPRRLVIRPTLAGIARRTEKEVFMRLRACLVVGAVTVVTLGLVPASAGPAGVPVGAGGRATPNVRLLSNTPTGTGTGGGFLGSTYFQTSADTVWFTAASTQAVTGGLLAFDASNPERPVVVGSLPIPHHENEDLTISAARHLVVISQQPFRTNPEDPTSAYQSGREYVVDVSVPSAMHLVGMVLLPAQVAKNAVRTFGGPGHTTTLVGGDNYLWVSGSRDGRVYVVDLHQASAPKLLGSFASPAGRSTPTWTPGVVHDVDVDRYGDVWVTGSGGTAMYRLTKDPLHPTLVASISAADNVRAQQYIHHGSQRLSRDDVLVTEEDYQAGCDSATHQDGSLQTWRIDRRAHRLVEIGSYDAPRGEDSSGPLSQLCSSHWFTINSRHVVADAWYGAGLRFLDYSNPRHPRPIGVWRGDSTIASQARFVPGRPDLVYVADYMRGLDVVQIDNGGAGARTVTPSDEQPVAATPGVDVPGLRIRVRLRPHEDFGWVCAVPTRM